MIETSPLGVNLLPPLLRLMATTCWQLSRFTCLVMSVEDSRLLAASFVLVCLQNRTGANEKPVQATTSERASLLMNNTARKLCLAVVARERENHKREKQTWQQLFLKK
jgi:hypothetical protein